MTETASTPWPMHRRVAAMTRILDRLADIPQTTRDLIFLEARLPTYSLRGFKPDDYLAPMSRLSDFQLAELEEATVRLGATQPPVVPTVEPIPQQDRTRYLEELLQVYREIGEDKELGSEDRAHFVDLVRSLGRALEDETEQGPAAVEKAAKFALADAALHPARWKRVQDRTWARRLRNVIAGILVTITALGGYGDAKELAQDIWDVAGPAIVRILPHDEAGQEPDEIETVDGEIVPDDPDEPQPDRPR